MAEAKDDRAIGTVLVVDDNEDLAENLAEILELEGFEAVVATSAEQALDALDDRRFGIVLTDVRMPGMDGIALLRRIRDAHPGLPVVLMTAYTREVQLDGARISGALQVLAKPVPARAVVDLAARAGGPAGNVLVLEDDDDLRTNYAEVLLEVPGVVPHPAGTLEEARKICSALHCRAAILDMRLPDGRGDALGRELVDRGTHVVYVTGYAEDLDHANDVVMPKPVSGERILDVVRNVVPAPQGDER